MIRQAAPGDLDEVFPSLLKFHAYSPYKDVPVVEEHARAFVAQCIAGGGVFLTETGVCGGMLVPLYFNPGKVVAAELFWWAPDGGGRELREAFENWARESGCFAVQFSALGDEHLERVSQNYLRNGYHQAEAVFVKEL